MVVRLDPGLGIIIENIATPDSTNLDAAANVEFVNQAVVSGGGGSDIVFVGDTTEIPASPTTGDLIFTTSGYVTDGSDLTEPQLTVTSSDRLYVFSVD